jgi:hypothetical protein
MASKIYITPEQLRNLAEAFKDESQKLYDIVNYLDKKIKEVTPPELLSEDKNYFEPKLFLDFESWKNDIQSSSKFLEKISYELFKITDLITFCDP